MARIHLIDASPYIFRAYFALPSSMTAPDGRTVNAVYGLASTLFKMIEDQSLTHGAIAFDRSLTTSFRNQLYPAYKQQRELPPADLERQLEDCERLVSALGFRSFASQTYEAEDLLGSLLPPLLAEDDAHRVVLVSSDKDLLQLVDDRVTLFDLAKGVHLDADAVVEKMGVAPGLVADFLGLAGDAVDNIPGVPGIGKKSAAALLGALGPLEKIYTDLAAVETLEVRGAKSLRRKLEEHREVAELSKQLATISQQAPVEATAAELLWLGADRAELTQLAQELGFGERLLARVPRWRVPGADRGSP